jgi:hypothetical protein
MRTMLSKLILILMALVSGAQAEYLQKFASKYSLDDRSLPAALTNAAAPLKIETPPEAPLPNMRIFAREKTGALWLGSSEGAARIDIAAIDPWERCHYFSGPRWLPDNKVQNIIVEEFPVGRKGWIRTETGVSCIEWRPFTLEKKAFAFEERILARHNRFGMVASSHLRKRGDLTSNLPYTTDNDGLWTAIYMAAECYRYAATKSGDARENAVRSLKLLMRLEEMTGIPGFPARSFIPADEQPPHEGEWHLSADKKWLWKGDTSSDELVGHFYAYSIFYDLVATASEKKQIEEVVERIAHHLTFHDFQLVDLDGKPTTWGRWDYQFHQTPGTGEYESALGSVEILSFMGTAFHITRNPEFSDASQKLLKMGYGERMRNYRRWPKGGEINFSDDELAFLSYYPLLKHETSPDRRKIYLEAVEFTCTQIKSDKNPLWNFIAVAIGAIPRNADTLRDSTATLQRIPMDLIEWPVHNSNRRDIQFRPNKDRFNRTELTAVLPPDERAVSKWNGNPYRPDGGDGGNAEDDGAYFLLPYWMGRYSGWIME